MTHIRKAVFPVAGLGTRFLPATKSIPKEMLPLVDRPLIQYAVDEARNAGIEEFIFVTSAGKGALEDYFHTASDLENRLRSKGKTRELEGLAQARMDEGSMSFVRQNSPLGLGHAVQQAKSLVGDQPFAVILPDDVIRARSGALSQMVSEHARTGGHMLATMQVPREHTSSYGILDVAGKTGPLSAARMLVEKPHPDHAPSTEAIVGRYILEPSIFERLDRLKPGTGGEFQLTDAINADICNVKVSGFRFKGERFDCGSVQGFVQATAAFALDRADLRDAYSDFLTDRLALQQRAA